MRHNAHLYSFSSAKPLLANERGSHASLQSFRRRTANLSAGCPSFGGQRTVGCHSTATVSSNTIRRAVWQPSCGTWPSSEFYHRRTVRLSAGCPSFGGQRKVGCHSTATVGATREAVRCGAVKLVRVHGLGLSALAPRPHGPNTTFQPTCSGLRPPQAAELRR